MLYVYFKGVKILENNILASAISTLFGAYGKANDHDRQAIYFKALSGLDPNTVMLACQKTIYNNKFLPSISEIFENVKSIVYYQNPQYRPKDWDEVLIEITQAVKQSPFEKFTWSSKDIERAVKSYGLDNLRYGEVSSYSYGLEVIRKNYLIICSRKYNNLQNAGIINGSNDDILGIEQKTLQITSSNGYYLLQDLIPEKLKKEGAK